MHPYFGMIHGMAMLSANYIVMELVIAIIQVFAIYIACKLLDIDTSFGSVIVFVIMVSLVKGLAQFVFGALGSIGGLFLELFIAKHYFDISWFKAFALFLVSVMVVFVLSMLGIAAVIAASIISSLSV